VSVTAPFPHRYEVDLVSAAEGAVSTVPGRPALPGGPPPEFGGRGDSWSPEHLLLASLNLCLKTTFDAVARRAGLTVSRYASHALGVLDKTSEGLVFTEFRVDVQVDARPEDVEQVRKIAQSAKKHCLVSAALRTPVVVQLNVREAP
jgi:organic hydroperoxide reductase OsmC/OhrA